MGTCVTKSQEDQNCISIHHIELSNPAANIEEEHKGSVFEEFKQTVYLNLGIFNNETSLYHKHWKRLTESNDLQVNAMSIELTIIDAIPSDKTIPTICEDADAIAFTFDLTDQSSLSSVFTYYLKARHQNKVCFPILL